MSAPLLSEWELCLFTWWVYFFYLLFGFICVCFLYFLFIFVSMCCGVVCVYVCICLCVLCRIVLCALTLCVRGLAGSCVCVVSPFFLYVCIFVFISLIFFYTSGLRMVGLCRLAARVVCPRAFVVRMGPVIMCGEFVFIIIYISYYYFVCLFLFFCYNVLRGCVSS